MEAPTTPIAADADDWMNDAEARKEFNEILTELDEKLKPLTDAMEASERLSEDDFAIMINARE